MPDRFELTNKACDCLANWKILDHLLDRMEWKDQRKMILALPPVCVASEMKLAEGLADGVVTPISGTLTRIVIRLNLSDKPPAYVQMMLEGTSTTSSEMFEISGNVFVKELKTPIETGTVVKLKPIGANISSLGFSLLISPKDSITRHVPNAFPSMEADNA